MPLSALAGKAAKRRRFAIESTARDDGNPTRRVACERVGSLHWGSHGFGTGPVQVVPVVRRRVAVAGVRKMLMATSSRYHENFRWSGQPCLGLC
jgi:hypothetical protein